MKKILLLGGSAQQVVAIETAKKLGYYTVLCDYLTDNPGQYVADKFYLVSTTDKGAILEVAQKEKVDGVLAYASDPAAPTAAYVGEKLKLPTNPYSAVEILCNKDRFRAFLHDHGFNAPISMGYQTVEDNLSVEKAPLKLLADEYWMISTADIDVLEEKCREEGVTAIMNGISTFNISVCMELCKRLNLPCYCTPESWHYTIDKRQFKDLCISCGVPVAKDYYLSKTPTEKELSEIQYPVVVKAIDQSANRGMSYCNSKEEVLAACEYARSYSASDTVIVERMLKGHEYTAWYALAGGKASLVNFGIMFEQEGYPSNCYSVTTTETNKLDLYLKEIDPYITTAFNKAGCKEGLAWIEMMLDDDGHFYVLETGYRMSGDMMALNHKNVCGFNTYAWLVDIATGVKHSYSDLPDPERKLPERCGCTYILWSKDGGKISEITGLDEIKKLEGINLNIDGMLNVGDVVKKHQYLLVITFDTATEDEMIDVIKKINASVAVKNDTGTDIVIRFDGFERLKAIAKEANKLGEE